MDKDVPMFSLLSLVCCSPQISSVHPGTSHHRGQQLCHLGVHVLSVSNCDFIALRMSRNPKPNGAGWRCCPPPPQEVEYLPSRCGWRVQEIVRPGDPCFETSSSQMPLHLDSIMSPGGGRLSQEGQFLDFHTECECPLGGSSCALLL